MTEGREGETLTQRRGIIFKIAIMMLILDPIPLPFLGGEDDSE
jgi:hypothetical protein